MRRIREVLRLSAIVGENISAIARGGKLARSTVRDYLDRAKAAGIDAAKAAEMTDDALEAALFPPLTERPKCDLFRYLCVTWRHF